MEYEELLKRGYPCIYCNHQDISGNWTIDINCKLTPNVSLWMQNKEKIKNCENFITKKQYERQQKIIKIINNT